MISLPGDLHAAPAFGASAAKGSVGLKAFILVAIFLIALVPLLATPVLPMIDFYNHVARYHVLATIDGDGFLQRNYQAAWAILPNIGLDVIVVSLKRVMPGGFGAHAIVVLIFAVQYSGVLVFNRVLTGRWSALVALLTVPLLYSFIFHWGFANFLLGLGLVFWAAAWWLAMRNRLWLALPVAMVLATGIFFVHGVAFALYGLLVAALELGLFLQKSPRRPLALAGAMLPLLAQAVVPAVLFLATKTSQNPDGITNADETVVRLAGNGTLGQRLWEVCQHRLITIVRVAEGPSLAFDAITLLLTLALIAWLMLRGRIGLAPPARPALAMAALLVVIVPPAMFGVGAVADRMPLFLAMLAVGALNWQPQGDRLDGLALAGFAALVAVRLFAITADWTGYARDKADFEAVAVALPRNVLVETIAVSAPRDSDSRLCQMFGPLLIAEHGAAGRLFANSDQQPIRIIGPLAEAIDKSGRLRQREAPIAQRQSSSLAAAERGGFPWLFTCDFETLADQLPAGSAIVAASGRFKLARLPTATALPES